ncbi:hypothetical protein D3C75_1203320 [compost metagenome]
MDLTATASGLGRQKCGPSGLLPVEPGQLAQCLLYRIPVFQRQNAVLGQDTLSSGTNAGSQHHAAVAKKGGSPFSSAAFMSASSTATG